MALELTDLFTVADSSKTERCPIEDYYLDSIVTESDYNFETEVFV